MTKASLAAWNAVSNAKLAREMILERISRLSLEDTKMSSRLMAEVRELTAVLEGSLVELDLLERVGGS